MPLSTRKIIDSINWAKRFNFNHNPVIGNSLEPALTSANVVIQTLLGPPFSWWWNNEELVFTCNPTPNSATSTAAVIAAGILTVTAPNTFAVGNLILASAFTGGLVDLNGELIEIATVIGTAPNYTGFTAVVTLPNGSDTVGKFMNSTTQDYTVAAPQFSHIEHSSVMDLTGNGTSVPYTPAKWYELTVKNNLSLETDTGRANFITPHVEDGNGNMTFRVMPAPDKPYPVSVHVQLTPNLITSINQTWAPLPDYLECVYDLGFLAWLLAFGDDPRAPYYNSQFKAALLARQAGISQQQRDIFLNNWDMLTSTQAMERQQGIKAREQ